jgi:hypothetical protein
MRVDILISGWKSNEPCWNGRVFRPGHLQLSSDVLHP